MMSERIQVDFSLLALRGKYPIPDGWEIIGWERKNFGTSAEYVEYRGAICGAVFSRGPRKGKKNWAKRHHEMTLPMTFAELDASRERWSAETGLCHHCTGNGTAWFGWDATKGDMYKPCKHCNSTGKLRATPTEGGAS